MKPRVTYPFQLFSCIVLLVAFVWLTIGASFFYTEQQKQVINKTESKKNADHSDNAADPFENASEEKTETSGNAFATEYLREDSEHFLYTNVPLKHNKCHFADASIAFYGEFVSPPPEILYC